MNLDLHNPADVVVIYYLIHLLSIPVCIVSLIVKTAARRKANEKLALRAHKVVMLSVLTGILSFLLAFITLWSGAAQH